MRRRRHHDCVCPLVPRWICAVATHDHEAAERLERRIRLSLHPCPKGAVIKSVVLKGYLQGSDLWADNRDQILADSLTMALRLQAQRLSETFCFKKHLR